MLDRARMRADRSGLLRRLGSSISPDAQAGGLSIAQQQLVEIAKALAVDARILVMDEPTAALERTEALRLLDLVKRLSAEGVTIVYVSHRMPEIQAVADRVTVLKDGRTVMTAPIAEAPTDAARARHGRPRPRRFLPAARRKAVRASRAESLRRQPAPREHRPRRAAGEIVGVAGLEGSGKTELGRAIAGDEPFESGTLEVAGKTVAPRHPRAAIAAGVGRLSEDRKREGTSDATVAARQRDPPPARVRAFARAADGRRRWRSTRTDSG